MKQKILSLLLTVMIFSFTSRPPQYFFSFTDETGREGGKPELTTAVFQKPKGKATTNEYIISGAKSTRRIKITQSIFFAHPDEATGSLDPSLYISLYKVSSGKTNRTLSMTTDGGGPNWIPLNITRVDASTIKIAPGIAMVPGEYVFLDKTTATTEGNYTAWAFGVD